MREHRNNRAHEEVVVVGGVLRMGDHRLPNRVMSGELENAGKMWAGGKETEWTDCVVEDLRLFGITEDCGTAATLETGIVHYVKGAVGLWCVGEGRGKGVRTPAEEERSGIGGQG